MKHVLVSLAAIALTVGALAGCEGAGGSRTAGMSAIAGQMQEARAVALQAAATAREAQAAREKDKPVEAERLSRAAIDRYREALSLSQDMPEVWNNLGVELMHVQDYVGASQAFTQAMQLSPTDPRPAVNLALVYDRTGWTEESLRYYDLALDRSPSYLPALRGAIKAAHLLGEASDERLELVRRALMIETDPTLREFFEREQVRIRGRLDQPRRP